MLKHYLKYNLKILYSTTVQLLKGLSIHYKLGTAYNGGDTVFKRKRNI